MRWNWIMGCALALAFLAPGAALFAQTAGQEFPMKVKLTSRVSSSANKKGDRISAQVVSPESLAGATVEGEVRDASASGNVKKESKLVLGFQTLIHNNERKAIRANVTGFTNSKGKANVDEEGRVIAKSSGVKKAAVLTAIGAGAGAAIGAAAGNAGAGAAAGAGAGLAAGLLLVTFGTKAPDIRFDSGSEMDLAVTIQP